MFPASGADLKILPGHVPRTISGLTALGRLAPTNELRLAIGLPPRDPAELDRFVAEVSDPASANYRKFLTPAEFTARFGPTEADYAAVKKFAATSGFKIIGTHDDRMLLDVSANASEVEAAFHIRLLKFRHPTEARDFFEPDAEPTVDVALPVIDIQGLSDYSRPKPRLKKLDATLVTPRNGSSPDGQGNYFGNDFRTAYVPGTTLTGAGQQVGLLQFDGYYASDILAYAQQAGGGRTNIVIQTISVDGYNGTPTTGANSGNGEVSLDIEMAMSMAPGLAKIVVFEANPNGGNPNTILAAMVTNTVIKQFSSSWGWSGGPSATTDNYFRRMITQGQSFFNASGDSCAFTVGASSANGVDNTSLDNAPASSPYITEVGATTLTTGSGAVYSSESVWNWGNSIGSQYNGVGSSGGVSSYYSITNSPWQTNINMTANLGSTTTRNTPDVALTGDGVYVISGGASPATGSSGNGGTSCAAPLWAGFMALVNQQAANLGNASAGFINPTIYAIGKGNNANYTYAACFHDVTAGNNFWSSSTTQYPAVSGYDLCTGWGTPAVGLIAALAGVADNLGVAPLSGFSFSGTVGGPFTPAAATLQLTNSGSAAFAWTLINTSAWLTVSASGGSLAVNGSASLTVGPSASSTSLALGNYSATLAVSNQSSQFTYFVPVTLAVVPTLSVSPANGFTAVGAVGGSFTPNTQTFALTNLGAGTTAWSLINTAAWLTASSSAGTLSLGAHTNVTVSLSSAANALPAGVYTANVIFSNQSSVVAVVPFVASVGQSLLQNGGFELGSFTDWTLTGTTTYMSVTTSSTFTHSGSYGAQLGPYLALSYLSQTLTTVPGQTYFLSFWFNNPQSGSTEQFQASWNGVQIYSLLNPPALGWTNQVFFVQATSSSTVLQFGIRNDPYYFGLDDVVVTPLAPVGFSSVISSGGGLQLIWTSTAGVNYQVQYKTNLLQSGWLNLGSALTATGGTLSTTDAAATAQSPQRFYRLQATP